MRPGNDSELLEESDSSNITSISNRVEYTITKRLLIISTVHILLNLPRYLNYWIHLNSILFLSKCFYLKLQLWGWIENLHWRNFETKGGNESRHLARPAVLDGELNYFLKLHFLFIDWNALIIAALLHELCHQLSSLLDHKCKSTTELEYNSFIKGGKRRTARPIEPEQNEAIIYLKKDIYTF